MQVEFAPRSSVAAWLRKGWRLVDGHDYHLEDWAVVLHRPEDPAPLTDKQVDRIAARFRRIPRSHRIEADSNCERAVKSRVRLVGKVCSVHGCENMSNARGYCMTHYKRWRRAGNPTVRITHYWTPEEDAQLLQLVAAGVHVHRVSIPGRSYRAIETRERRLRNGEIILGAAV